MSFERQSELKNQMMTLENKIQMVEKNKKKDADKVVEHEKNVKSHTKEVKKLSPDLEQSGRYITIQLTLPLGVYSATAAELVLPLPLLCYVVPQNLSKAASLSTA